MSEKQKNSTQAEIPILCGIVMPISGFLDYPASHWAEVRGIIERSIKNAGFSPRAVWESTDTDIIHARIVTNLYNDEIVVVDASGLNPNVMFELGMRLTFKKPTVIVADDNTKLPFDTSNIEHIIYPRDLHFGRVETFMRNLTERIIGVRTASVDGSYKPYLDSFGAFTVVQPEQGSVKFDDFVVEKLSELSAQLAFIRREQGVIRNLSMKSSSEYEHGNISTYAPFIRENELAASPLLEKFWTDERIEKLKIMWGEGKSPSEIAVALGDQVSRNAIIGKAHRIGLQSRPVNKSEF